jgi:transposase
MTNLNLSDVRIFVCLTPIRMQFSFDTLMGLAQETFNQDPLSGHLFLFFNRKRDRIKILFWDVDGFCIWYKRLEVGVFQLPVATEGDQGIELNSRQLNQLLEGLDLRNGRRRRRYRRVS